MKPFRAALALLLPCLALVGCGSCPPQRYQAAEPAHDVTNKYSWKHVTRDGACVRIGERWTCYSEADLALLTDPKSTCADVCKTIQQSDDPVKECSFNEPAHDEVSCTSHVEAEEERCTCSILDC